jgi:hypothetical protein
MSDDKLMIRNRLWLGFKNFSRWIVRYDDSSVMFAIKRALLCSLIPLPFAIALTLLGVPTKGGVDTTALLVTAFFLLLAAPLVENGLLVLVTAYANFFAPPWLSALVGAGLIALAHGLIVPAWGMLVLPMFFIQALIYLSWARYGRMKAYLVTVLIHALINVPFVAMIVLDH